MKTAKDLINRSVSHTETVFADLTQDLVEDLRLVCDDYIHARPGLIEFWGTTESGDEWRVHLKRPASES